jgi:hypothetical protein
MVRDRNLQKKIKAEGKICVSRSHHELPQQNHDEATSSGGSRPSSGGNNASILRILSHHFITSHHSQNRHIPLLILKHRLRMLHQNLGLTNPYCTIHKSPRGNTPIFSSSFRWNASFNVIPATKRRNITGGSHKIFWMTILPRADPSIFKTKGRALGE